MVANSIVGGLCEALVFSLSELIVTLGDLPNMSINWDSLNPSSRHNQQRWAQRREVAAVLRGLSCTLLDLHLAEASDLDDRRKAPDCKDLQAIFVACLWLQLEQFLQCSLPYNQSQALLDVPLLLVP